MIAQIMRERASLWPSIGLLITHRNPLYSLLWSVASWYVDFSCVVAVGVVSRWCNGHWQALTLTWSRSTRWSLPSLTDDNSSICSCTHNDTYKQHVHTARLAISERCFVSITAW